MLHQHSAPSQSSGFRKSYRAEFLRAGATYLFDTAIHIPNSLVWPHQPEVHEGAGDTSNFDDYPDSAEGSTVACDPRDNKLFEDF